MIAKAWRVTVTIDFICLYFVSFWSVNFQLLSTCQGVTFIRTTQRVTGSNFFDFRHFRATAKARNTSCAYVLNYTIDWIEPFRWMGFGLSSNLLEDFLTVIITVICFIHLLQVKFFLILFKLESFFPINKHCFDRPTQRCECIFGRLWASQTDDLRSSCDLSALTFFRWSIEVVGLSRVMFDFWLGCNFPNKSRIRKIMIMVKELERIPSICFLNSKFEFLVETAMFACRKPASYTRLRAKYQWMPPASCTQLYSSTRHQSDRLWIGCKSHDTRADVAEYVDTRFTRTMRTSNVCLRNTFVILRLFDAERFA